MCEILFITQQLGNRTEHKALTLYLTKYNTATEPVSLTNRIIITIITSDL